MDTKTSEPELAFARALRSFQGGSLRYTDFLAQINQQLASGASPGILLQILRSREVREPLPPYAHEAVVGLLEAAAGADGEAQFPSSSFAAAASFTPAAEPATVILEDADEDQGLLDDATPAPAFAPRSLSVDEVLLARFRLVALIGEGGMSRVYKATDGHPLAEYAGEPFIVVKVLNRPFNQESESFAALRQEVQTLRRLEHPNIVRMFACEREGSTVLITMEYLAGRSLFARMHAGARIDGDARTEPGGDPAAAPARLDAGQARFVVKAIAAALQQAHEHQIVHGDLKPGNVILTERGEVKVIDFGLASWISRPRSAQERREAVQTLAATAVTPRYASPQLMARQKPETTDDVYALACMAYELCAGSHPFEDDGAAGAVFPPPLKPGLSKAEYTAIVNGLQRERRSRTPTVALFMEEFRAARPRPAWMAGALWAAAVLIAVAAGWFYGHWPSPQSSPPPAAVSVPPASVPQPAPAAQIAPPPRAAGQAGAVIRDCPTCPLMTVLPAGRFKQGYPPTDRSATPFQQPEHGVVIDHAFAMAKNDVTVGEFREFIAATHRNMQGCDVYDGRWRRRPNASWSDPGFAQSSLHPVTCVSWSDAVAYARWLSAKAAHQYRLPSAAEWEYAARAGGEAVRPWEPGGADACGHANVADQSAVRRYPGWEAFSCDDGYVNTAPVGSFKANAFGLHDMLGNVFQWTEDCWHRNYVGAPADGSARMDGDCSERELRGGSWFSSPTVVKTSYRNHFAAGYRTSSVGFRLVRELTP